MRNVLLAAGLVGCGSELMFGRQAETPELPTTSTTAATSTSTTPNDPLDCDDDAVLEVTELLFAARANCDFSNDGNLDPRNEHLQARAEESHFVELPQGATLCALALESQGDRAAFDDHVAVLVEDVLVVSGGSGGTLDDYPLVDGLPRFDWTTVRGRPFADRYTPYGCLGGGRCIVPRTEESGPFDVQIEPETMAELVGALALDAGFDVRLLVFGDDDWGDCAHSDLALDLSVRYLP